MTKLPTVSSYVNYDGDNYGVHCLKVDLGEIEFYYSYKTIVAYCDDKDGLIVSENLWKTTTGKHLNAINPDKKSRYKRDVFEKMLSDAMERHIQ